MHKAKTAHKKNCKKKVLFFFDIQPNICLYTTKACAENVQIQVLFSSNVIRLSDICTVTVNF